MKKDISTKGYSLVEVLVAIGILMLSIVGPLTIAAKSMQSAQYARQQTTAFFLAQEGISAINAIRNSEGAEYYIGLNTNPWGWVTDNALIPCYETTGCNLDFRDESLMDNIVNCADSGTPCNLLFRETSSRAAYQLQSGAPSPFTRIITLERSGDEILVESKVQWGSTLLGGTQEEVTLNTSLFNLFKD